MNCPACHAANPDTAAFCARCGQTLATPCPKCGQGNRSDVRFCGTCGHSLREPTPVGVSCPACGAANKPDVRFCGDCGSSMAAVAAQPAPPGVAERPATRAHTDSAQLLCPSCSALVKAGERFCAGCGGRLGGDTGPARVLETARPAIRDTFAAPPVTAESSPSAGSAWHRAKWGGVPVMAIAIVAIVILAGGAIFLYPKLRGHSESTVSGVAANAPNTTESQVSVPDIPVTVYATRLTRMRDAPTSQGSNVVGNLNRGEAVTGTWIMGHDGTTRWLKVARAGQTDAYAWGTNLSSTPRPVATRLIGEDRTVIIDSAVYAEPREGAPWLESIAHDGVVNVTAIVPGEDGREWAEVAMRAGGIGYLRADALSAGPPIATAPAPTVNSLGANPQDLRQLAQQAQDYMARSDEASAIAIYDRMIAMSPNDAVVYNSRCWARVMKGDFSNANLNAAMSDCNTALTLRPNDSNTLDSRAMVYLEMRQYGSAVNDFNAALRGNSRLANSYYGRGLARLAQSDRSGARSDFLSAVGLDANIGQRFDRIGMHVDASLTH